MEEQELRTCRNRLIRANPVPCLVPAVPGWVELSGDPNCLAFAGSDAVPRKCGQGRADALYHTVLFRHVWFRASNLHHLRSESGFLRSDMYVKGSGWMQGE